MATVTQIEWWFSLSHNGAPHGEEDHFRDVLTELQRFPSCNVLERVKLRIGMDAIHKERYIIVKEDWLPLATSFANRDAFPCLEEVDVDVAGWGWEEAVDDDVDSGKNFPMFDLYKLPFEELDLHFKFVFSPKNWDFYPSSLYPSD